MIEARSLQFRYDEVEDRLFLDCFGDESARTLLLTRRITRRLLHVFANALANSSPVLQRVPIEARQEVIALEHFSSLAAAAPPSASGPAAPAEPLPNLGQDLVWKVDIQIEPVLFRLVLHSPDAPLASLALTRGDFHKLLAVLDHWAVDAEWNIRGDAGWLNGAQEAAISGAGRNAS
jgi:hypothetical protein